MVTIFSSRCQDEFKIFESSWSYRFDAVIIYLEISSHRDRSLTQLTYLNDDDHGDQNINSKIHRRQKGEEEQLVRDIVKVVYPTRTEAL